MSLIYRLQKLALLPCLNPGWKGMRVMSKVNFKAKGAFFFWKYFWKELLRKKQNKYFWIAVTSAFK